MFCMLSFVYIFQHSETQDVKLIHKVMPMYTNTMCFHVFLPVTESLVMLKLIFLSLGIAVY